MEDSVTATTCGTHFCDCRIAADSEAVDGVVLIAERRHVRNKVGVLLEQADGLRLEALDAVLAAKEATAIAQREVVP